MLRLYCKSGEITWETNAGVCVGISNSMAVMRKVVTSSGGTIRASSSSEGEDKALLQVSGTAVMYYTTAHF